MGIGLLIDVIPIFEKQRARRKTYDTDITLAHRELA